MTPIDERKRDPRVESARIENENVKDSRMDSAIVIQLYTYAFVHTELVTKKLQSPDTKEDCILRRAPDAPHSFSARSLLSLRGKRSIPSR